MYLCHFVGNVREEAAYNMMLIVLELMIELVT